MAFQGINSDMYSVNDHTNPPSHKRNTAWYAMVLQQTNKAQEVVGLPLPLPGSEVRQCPLRSGEEGKAEVGGPALMKSRDPHLAGRQKRTCALPPRILLQFNAPF